MYSTDSDKPGQPRASVRQGLIGGIGLLILASLVLALLTVFHLKQEAENDAHALTRDLADSLHLFVQSWVSKIDLALFVASEEVSDKSHSSHHLIQGKPDVQAIDAYLRTLAAQLPGVNVLRGTDAEGRVLYGDGGLNPPAEVGDRDYFQQLRSNPNSALVISPPVRGRVSNTWLWTLARAIRTPDGQFAGVMVAAVHLERIKQIFAQVELHREVQIILRDPDHGVLTRFAAGYQPAPEQFRAEAPDPAFLNALQHNPLRGHYLCTCARNDRPRLHAYHRDPEQGYTLDVGLPVDVMEAGWQQQAYLIGGLELAFILACLAFGWSIDRTWRQRERYIDELDASHAALSEAERLAQLGHYQFDLPRGHWTSSENLDRIFGIGPDYPRDLGGWLALVEPEQRSSLQDYLQQVLEGAGPFDRQYAIHRHSDGGLCWVHGLGQVQRDAEGRVVGLFGTIQDISREKLAKQREMARSRILELIAAGTALPEVLQAIVESVEQQNPLMMCSILLLDESGEHLINGASPSLPDFYVHAVSGVRIGPDVGSCGTAAFTQQRVVVEDIGSHPYWAPFRDLAKQAGLAACWSQPILGVGRRLLGTFAIYHDHPQGPRPEDIHLIEQSAALASIAIERHQADCDLHLSEQRLRFALDGAGDGIWEYELNSGINRVSPGMLRLLGMPVPSDQHLSMQQWPHLPIDHLHPDSLSRILAALQAIQDGLTEQYEVEQQVRCGDGRYKWLLSRGMVIERDERGQPLRMIGTSVDINRRKQMEQELTDQARLDDLTGMCNRRYFMKQAQREISRARRHPQPLSLLMMDLDFFKQINDRHGHLVGDAVLRHLADLCRHMLREEDILGRLGGEEFAVLLPDTDQHKALEAAERIRQSVAESPLQQEQGPEVPFTLSIGVASLGAAIEDLEQLLGYADRALYAAKADGRNRVVSSSDLPPKQ